MSQFAIIYLYKNLPSSSFLFILLQTETTFSRIKKIIYFHYHCSLPATTPFAFSVKFHFQISDFDTQSEWSTHNNKPCLSQISFNFSKCLDNSSHIFLSRILIRTKRPERAKHKLNLFFLLFFAVTSAIDSIPWVVIYSSRQLLFRICTFYLVKKNDFSQMPIQIIQPTKKDFESSTTVFEVFPLDSLHILRTCIKLHQPNPYFPQ